MSAVRQVGVRELRDRLSAVLRRVKRGEVVTVSDRRRPVAVLVPISAALVDRALAALATAGRLSWAGGKPAGARAPARVRGQTVAGVVIEDRR